MQSNLPKAHSFGLQNQPDSGMAGIEGTDQILQENKLKTQVWDISHAAVKMMTCEAGN